MSRKMKIRIMGVQSISDWFFNIWYNFLSNRIFYWLRCHTYNKYHLVDCRTNDYKWGYMDPCTLMLYANFSLLCDFIENEHAFEIVDYSWDEEHQRIGKELKELYDWWKVGRFQEKAKIDEQIEKIHASGRISPYRTLNADGSMTINSEYFQSEAWKEYEYLRGLEEAKEDIMLFKLLNLRRNLWT